jgi:hypothetical protein
MPELDPTLNLARITARRSQAEHFNAVAQDLEAEPQTIERNTYQGYDPTTGLLKRQPLRNVANAVGSANSGSGSNNLAVISDGVKVFNRSVRIGKPIWTVPTAGNARLIAQYIKRQVLGGDRQVLRRRTILKSPQPVTWMAIAVTLDSNVFELPYSFIPTYADYVAAPFTTPANFNLFNTIRNFNDLGQDIELNVGGGINNSISGSINTDDSSFAANYTTRVVSFSYQIFRVQPGDLSITVTLEQDDGLGGTSATTTVNFVGSTGARQANGLYLISFDQSIFPAGVLNINTIAQNVAVRMSYE